MNSSDIAEETAERASELFRNAEELVIGILSIDDEEERLEALTRLLPIIGVDDGILNASMLNAALQLRLNQGANPIASRTDEELGAYMYYNYCGDIDYFYDIFGIQEYIKENSDIEYRELLLHVLRSDFSNQSKLVHYNYIKDLLMHNAVNEVFLK